MFTEESKRLGSSSVFLHCRNLIVLISPFATNLAKDFSLLTISLNAAVSVTDGRAAPDSCFGRYHSYSKADSEVHTQIKSLSSSLV